MYCIVELTQKLNSLATKTADVTVEEKKKTKVRLD